MCKPSINNNNSRGGVETKNVVVAGAGPAGLLMTLHLLERNKQQNQVHYNVTLIDANQDYGKLNPKTELKHYRSWMIGLASHGLTALRQFPVLYKDYVSDVGVRLESFSIHLGTKEIKQSSGGEGEDSEAYIVDRNFIVAALARYLRDTHDNDEACETLYDTKMLYVDYENKRVLVRHGDEEQYIDYDYLIGCDGVRSCARDAIMRSNRDFECDVGDIFQHFKAVHVQRPKSVDAASLHLLPDCFSQMQGIALPETGDMLNISMGVPRNNFAKLPEELKSNDPTVVAEYAKQNFKALELVDYDDFAHQWVNQRWNRTGQVHCNLYHSTEHGIVIMGDAAHATSPSIGMGMNTALADASAFNRLLDEFEEDWNKALPAFSKERVKEGNALTDLAMHLYCLDTRQQFLETLHMVIRGAFSKALPFLVSKHPQEMIGRPNSKLSDVYDHAVKLGIMTKHRAINNKIRQEYFEQSTGMVKYKQKHFGGLSLKLVVPLMMGLVAVVAKKAM